VGHSMGLANTSIYSIIRLATRLQRHVHHEFLPAIQGTLGCSRQAESDVRAVRQRVQPLVQSHLVRALLEFRDVIAGRGQPARFQKGITAAP